MQLYVNPNKKTPDEVRALTGADIVINGGLFNSAFVPVTILKVDGKYLSLEDDGYWGYAWNMGGRPVFTQSHRDYENFICCITLWKDGPASYPPAMGGIRGRTAMGLTADGRCVVYCAADGTSGTMTPEALSTFMHNSGCKNAVMLDGGGSSQGLVPGLRVRADRKVQNLICIWEDK